MAFDKVRIRFRKSGGLRLVSHLDLMRAFERLLRRAGLPVRMTEGFHPAPRLIFAQSLSLGLVGRNEVVEIEFTEEIPPEDVLARLRAQAPPGLDFHSCTRIPVKTAARPRRAVYRWPIVGWQDGGSMEENPSPSLASTHVQKQPTISPPARGGMGGGQPARPLEAIDKTEAQPPPNPPLAGGETVGRARAEVEAISSDRIPSPPAKKGSQPDTTAESLAARLADLLAQPELWVDREKPRPRQLNVRPYLRNAWADAEAVWFDIWLTQDGTARVDELARLAGLGDLFLTGPPVERFDLEIADETDPAELARTPTITPQSRPWNGGPTTPPAVPAPRDVWGATENGPIVE